MCYEVHLFWLIAYYSRLILRSLYHVNENLGADRDRPRFKDDDALFFIYHDIRTRYFLTLVAAGLIRKLPVHLIGKQCVDPAH